MLKSITMRTALGLSVCAALCFWNCNVSEAPASSILRMSLPDSLATEYGLYDSVVVDLHDADNIRTHSAIFSESYEIASDTARLADLRLKTKAPRPLIIRITAYKDKVALLVLQIHISDNGRVEMPPVLLDRGDTTGTVVKPPTIAISNSSPLILYVGDAPVVLSASIQPPETPGEIAWSLPATDAAVILEGNKIKGLAPGMVAVKAALTGNSAIFSILEVEVKAAPITPPDSVVIANSFPLTLVVGGSAVPLQAAILPAGALQSVTWSLPPTDVAKIESGNQIRGLKVGAIQVTAASVANPSISSTLSVTVLEAVSNPPISLTISNASPLALSIGSTVNLQAVVVPEGSSPNVVWTMESAGIAEIVSNNQVRGLKEGTGKIIATSAVKSELSDTLLVHVSALVVNPTSVVLNMPTPLTLAMTDSPAVLSARVLPAGADSTVLWTSSNPLVAEITPDNRVKPLKAGKTTLTVKSKADPALFATLEVEVVVPVQVDAISISPKRMTLYTGGADSLVTVTMTGTKIDSAKFNLVSSAPLIATVLANGVIKGLKAGEAVITAKVVGSELAGECSVEVVTDPPVVAVTADQSIAYGGEATFTVSVTQAYGTVVDIKADMDGDGIFEEIIPGKSAAEFKKTYSDTKSVTVKFEVKDSEGNVASAVRKVAVGAPGVPLVNIFNPSKDTTLSVLSYKIRFSVKDTSMDIDTTVDSTVSLKEGINNIKAARRNAGGEGSDVVVITTDTTKPAVTIATTPATTNSLALTLSGTASDAGTGLQSITVSGALAGNGAATLAAGQWSKTGLTLKEGANTLTATATDKAGNTGSVSVSIVLDAKKPGVPVVTAPGASRTNLIKWTWTKANADGSGRFKVKLGTGAEIDVGTALEYTHTALADNTVYGLSVKETDPVAGDGLWSDQKNVLFDSKSPDPVLSRNAATTNAPKWSWTSNGGSGTFRWHYSGSAAGSAGTGTGLSFAPANLANGPHTLCVQEKESPAWGEVWGKSPETCLGITVDKTGPAIKNILPKPGFITNQDKITVTYTADEVAGSFVCDLKLNGQANPCEKTVTDAFGNSSLISTSIWRRSNVVFVKEGGTGAGTNWDDALGNLYVALNSASNTGKEIWVGAGSYTREGGEWNILGNMAVYGGFTPDTYPTSIASRNTNANKSKVTGVYFFVGAQERSGIRLDGFNFSELRLIIEAMSSKITIANSDLTGQTACEYGCLLVRGDDVLIENVRINSLRGIDAALYVYSFSATGDGIAGKVRINGGQINDNTLNQFGTAPVNIQAGNVTFEGGLNIIGNTGSNTFGAQAYLWGGSNPLTLTVNSGVQIEGGKSSILMSDDGLGNPLACLYYMGEKGAGCR